MTEKNYLIIESNVVTNSVLWDGNTETWQPPPQCLMIVNEETEALVWTLTEDQLDTVLAPVLGAGAIGFTWDGSTLKTNEPKPIQKN